MTVASAQTILVVACAAWWLLSVTVHVLSAALALVQPTLTRRNSRDDQPPVSILVPVKDFDPRLDAAFVSVFSQTYPRFEVLISAADTSSTALTVASAVAARFPQIQSQIIISDTRVAVSPKLNNLVAPLAKANSDLVLIKDSGIQLASGQLADLVRELGPGVGLVAVVAIAREPANFWAEVECAFMNGYQARMLLAASALGLGFGTGGCMLFDRREFVRSGGVQAIAETIAEDHALSKALARIGLKTVLARSVAKQSLGSRQLSAIWNRQLRWMICRRVEEPLAFLGEPFLGAPYTVATGAIGAAAVGLPAWIAVAGTLAVWFLIEGLFLKLKGWPCPRSAPWPWFCREILALALWVRAWSTTSVVWGDVMLPVRPPRA